MFKVHEAVHEMQEKKKVKQYIYIYMYKEL